MPLTLDNLARELMCWFDKETNKSGIRVWNDELELINAFASYLNVNSNIKALQKHAVAKVEDRTHLVLYKNEEKTNEGIIAKFMIDGKKKNHELNDVIMEATYQLNENNLNKDFQSTTKCIVSIYNDLNNRRKFHENEFIEIYQRYGMGCAIKRLK